MSYLSQIENLWSKGTGNIEDIMYELLSLLKKAEEMNEPIPLELKSQILIQANHSLGYGTEVADAQDILKLIMTLDHNFIDAPRLAALLMSSIVNALTIDEQVSSSMTNQILQPINVEMSANRVACLKKLIPVISIFIDHPTKNLWYYEYLTFLILMIGLIHRLEGTNIFEDKTVNEIKLEFSKNNDQKESDALSDWLSNHNEKNDFYRFTTLMITGKYAPEDEYGDLIKFIKG